LTETQINQCHVNSEQLGVLLRALEDHLIVGQQPHQFLLFIVGELVGVPFTSGSQNVPEGSGLEQAFFDKFQVDLCRGFITPQSEVGTKAA